MSLDNEITLLERERNSNTDDPKLDLKLMGLYLRAGRGENIPLDFVADAVNAYEHRLGNLEGWKFRSALHIDNLEEQVQKVVRSKNPDDAVNTARRFVQAHEFHRAFQFYEMAIKNGKRKAKGSKKARWIPPNRDNLDRGTSSIPLRFKGNDYDIEQTTFDLRLHNRTSGQSIVINNRWSDQNFFEPSLIRKGWMDYLHALNFGHLGAYIITDPGEIAAPAVFGAVYVAAKIASAHHHTSTSPRDLRIGDWVSGTFEKGEDLPRILDIRPAHIPKCPEPPRYLKSRGTFELHDYAFAKTRVVHTEGDMFPTRKERKQFISDTCELYARAIEHLRPDVLQALHEDGLQDAAESLSDLETVDSGPITQGTNAVDAPYIPR